jgi:hypothetical protein
MILLLTTELVLCQQGTWCTNMFTKIRYSVDNQIYDIIWKVVPGKLKVNLCIMYNSVETVVQPDQIIEWIA